MIFGAYEVIEEHKKRVEVINALKEIEKKLNISFYEVNYIMIDLDVCDELGEKELNKYISQ